MTNAPPPPLRPSRHIEALLALGADDPQCSPPDGTFRRDPMIDTNPVGNTRRISRSRRAHPSQ